MTQQDETAHDATADQSAPSPPSPYLEASEAAPEAYLAPPQPGQPKYGAPSSYGPRPLNGGFGPQPANGQHSGYGQPDRGRAGTRTPPGVQARRDPAIATLWARLAAGTLDWLIINGISTLAFWSQLTRLGREWQAILDSLYRHNTPAMRAALNSLRTDPSARDVLFYWGVTLAGIALAYYWVQHAAWGATVGKRVAGLRVVQANGHERITARTAGIRAIAFLVGPALAWTLGASVIGSVLWAADNCMALVDPRAQSMHDKVAGTVVVRKRWLDQQARSASR